MRQAVKLLPIIATLGVFAAPSAQAVLFDFATIADTEGEQGFKTFTRTDLGSGITLTATGTSVGDLDGTPDYYAYLDSSFDGRRAGLGVCQALGGSKQCKDPADDDVESGELLTLSFNQEVTVDSIWFRNLDHFTTFSDGAEFSLSIDGGAFSNHTLTHLFDTPLIGSTFKFVTDDVDLEQFYIEKMSLATASVPEPTTLGLMGMSLLAMGWRQRARSQA